MTEPLFSAELEGSDLLVIEAHGAMTAISMQVALEMLIPTVEHMSHGGMLMRAKDVQWPTLGAIAVELRHWPQLMGMIKKIDKIALLTNQSWVRTWAGLESSLIPNLVIKSFDPDQEEAARAWLAAAGR